MPFPYRKILCAVDFDDYCAAAVKEAAALALAGGKLFLLHVVHINPLTAQGAIEGAAAPSMLDAQEHLAREKLDPVLTDLPVGLSYEVVVEMGAPVEVIVATGEKLGADLIVIATHGRTGLKHMVLGSIAEDVLHHSHVPVLMVRPPVH